MSLSERERAIAKAFGQELRRRERWMSVALFFVALMCGLIGAYFGVHAVLSLFAAVAIVFSLQIAFAQIRKILDRRNA